MLGLCRNWVLKSISYAIQVEQCRALDFQPKTCIYSVLSVVFERDMINCNHAADIICIYTECSMGSDSMAARSNRCSFVVRHNRIIWLAWYQRGYSREEDLAKWLFGGYLAMQFSYSVTINKNITSSEPHQSLFNTLYSYMKGQKYVSLCTD